MDLCKAKKEEEEKESMSLLENKHSEQRTGDFPYLPSVWECYVLCEEVREMIPDPGYPPLPIPFCMT